MSTIGRPPKYKTAEEMQVKIDEYFKQCEGETLYDNKGEPRLNKFGDVIRINQHPPTMSGLAIALGFDNRKSLILYEPKPAFMDTITRAKGRVERYAEERLFDRDGQRGAEFSLKHNYKWDSKADDASGSELLMSIVKVLASGQSTPDKPETGTIS